MATGASTGVAAAETAYKKSLCVPLPALQERCVNWVGPGAYGMDRLELLQACGIKKFEAASCGMFSPVPRPVAPRPTFPPQRPGRTPTGGPGPGGGGVPGGRLPGRTPAEDWPGWGGSVPNALPVRPSPGGGGYWGQVTGNDLAVRDPNVYGKTPGVNQPGGPKLHGLAGCPCNGMSDPRGLAAIVYNPHARRLKGLAAATDGGDPLSGEFPTVPAPPPAQNPSAADFRPGNWDFEKCTYAIAFGDTFVGLAKTYLGDGTQWKVIWDAQPQEWRFTHDPNGGKGPKGDKIPVQLGEKLIMPKAACDRAKKMLADPNSNPKPSTIGQKAPIEVPGEDPNAPTAPGSTQALAKGKLSTAVKIGAGVVGVGVVGGLLYWAAS